MRTIASAAFCFVGFAAVNPLANAQPPMPRKAIALFRSVASLTPSTPLRSKRDDFAPIPPGNRPRRQNRFASSDDSDFPEATTHTGPQTAPCFARHSFCSPPPNLFRVRLFDSLNAKERRSRSLRVVMREEERSSERWMPEAGRGSEWGGDRAVECYLPKT